MKILNFTKKHIRQIAVLAMIAMFATTTMAFAGTNNMGNGDDYEFDVDIDKPDTEKPKTIVIDIVNHYTPSTVTITGTKTWDDSNDQDGARPTEITIYLYANEVKTGDEAIVSEATNWQYSFENMPEYSNGEAIKYTIKEGSIDGYVAEYIVR